MLIREVRAEGQNARLGAQFRAWFLEYDWAAWDRQLEEDVEVGKLDQLADKALRDHATGKTKPL